MLQILTNQLKAAVTMAATKGVRYYLKGVCITVAEDGAVQPLIFPKGFADN